MVMFYFRGQQAKRIMLKGFFESLSIISIHLGIAVRVKGPAACGGVLT